MEGRKRRLLLLLLMPLCGGREQTTDTLTRQACRQAGADERKGSRKKT
jgi:hypothetical protein